MIQSLTSSECSHCGQIALWVGDKMIFPRTISFEQPNNDLPVEIQQDYLEVASIYQDSPRAASALSRLSIEKLCIHLGEEKGKLTVKIGNLVKKGYVHTNPKNA